MLRLLPILLSVACATADAGGFYGQAGTGGGGGGGDVPGAITQIGLIDFTSFASAQDLTASGDVSYVLEDGTTVLVEGSGNGTLDVLASGAGLDFTRSASNGPALLVNIEDNSYLTPYDQTAQVAAVVEFDTANTDITTSSVYVTGIWHGAGTAGTSAGNVMMTCQIVYDGSTYDIGGFSWDGGFRNSIPQSGNVADFPAWLYVRKDGPSSSNCTWGDSASRPTVPGDFDTPQAAGVTSIAGAATTTAQAPQFSSTSDTWFILTGVGAYTDIRVKSVAFYRFQ